MHVVKTFLRWTYLRAVFHRGYVLTPGLYFVVDAHLSASQIVLLGTVVSATLALADIPTGVWADAIGRKWPLVIGHLFLAAGMVMTGLVTAFPLILVTQVLWGSGWAFLTGADVAWITDELDQPQRIARVLTTSARRDLAGGATGMVVFGVLGWATSLATAMRLSVSVPVLSTHRTVAAPSVSITGARRASTLALDSRQAPRARKMVRTTGNSSGSIAIARVIPARSPWSQLPRLSP